MFPKISTKPNSAIRDMKYSRLKHLWNPNFNFSDANGNPLACRTDVIFGVFQTNTGKREASKISTRFSNEINFSFLLQNIFLKIALTTQAYLALHCCSVSSNISVIAAGKRFTFMNLVDEFLSNRNRNIV